MKKNFFTLIGLLVLLLAGVVIFRHWYVQAQTCFTTASVASDSRCLYIWSGKVFERGSKSRPHQGHQCGIDITSIIPRSHSADLASYLDPNYKGDICAVSNPTPTLTPTPTPTPTSTVKSLSTPTPTPASNSSTNLVAILEINPVCGAGYTRCKDSNNMDVCKNDQTGWQTVPCPYGCVNNYCRNAPNPTKVVVKPTVTPTVIPISTPTPVPTVAIPVTVLPKKDNQQFLIEISKYCAIGSFALIWFLLIFHFVKEVFLGKR